MSKKKQPLKSGEKILFGIVAVFIVMASVSYFALESYRHHQSKPMYVVKTHFDFSEEGKVGSRLFRIKGCTECHKALRNGTNNGLDLDGDGSRRSLEWLLAFFADPEKTYNARTFDHGAAPKQAAYVADLPEKQRHALAVFVSELKADQGSADAPEPPKGRSQFIDSMVGAWAPKSWHKEFKDIRDVEAKKQESQQTGSTTSSQGK